LQPVHFVTQPLHFMPQPLHFGEKSAKIDKNAATPTV